MDKCVIWGSDADYELIINQIKYEEFKGNIQVIAVVARKMKFLADKEMSICL